ncbi:MAG: flagellar protein FlaG [Alcaligenaceae bacterium]|nr:flagellar protein FlaG [Alcaligenaceae bacterium]
MADAAATPQRPEPAVQVTHAESARNGGNATSGDHSAGTGEDAFEEINAAMQAWDTGMRFEIDEDTQQLVVSVIDSKTGDTLRQIPSEEVLHIAKMVAQFQGKLINVKA